MQVADAVKSLRVPLHHEVALQARLAQLLRLLDGLLQIATDKGWHQHVDKLPGTRGPTVDQLGDCRPLHAAQDLDFLPLVSQPRLPWRDLVAPRPLQLLDLGDIHLLQGKDLAVPQPLGAVHGPRRPPAEVLHQQKVAAEAVPHGALREVNDRALAEGHRDVLADPESSQRLPQRVLVGGTEVLADVAQLFGRAEEHDVDTRSSPLGPQLLQQRRAQQHDLRVDRAAPRGALEPSAHGPGADDRLGRVHAVGQLPDAGLLLQRPGTRAHRREDPARVAEARAQLLQQGSDVVAAVEDENGDIERCGGSGVVELPGHHLLEFLQDGLRLLLDLVSHPHVAAHVLQLHLAAVQARKLLREHL
mmetsp:Transcript_146553/g.470158  ORF Transcript_146553/g.470158 Transcript_146553/m.470158 type:complete len:360 (+) Transcript_146553:784-1863(+)